MLKNIILGWKGSPRTSILALVISSSVTKKKCFKTLATCVNVIKLFLFIADDEDKRLPCGDSLEQALAFRLDKKGSPRINILAFIISSSAMKKKMF